MIEVTRKDMEEFINSQPDDKLVDMSENEANDDCGCLMVQYGKSKGWDFTGCGFSVWEKLGVGKVACIRTDAFMPLMGLNRSMNVLTYAKLKEFVKTLPKE